MAARWNPGFGAFVHFLGTVLHIILPWSTTAKIFTPCELATELYVKESIEWGLIADFVCIADVATGRNSSFIQPIPESDSTNYGIFRIHHLHWCHDGFELDNLCNVNCTDLVSDDISVSIKCAHIIYTEHNGFDAWSDWVTGCKDTDVDEYVRDCDLVADPDPGQNQTTLYVLAISLPVLAVFVLSVTVFCLWRRRNDSAGLSVVEIREFEDGIPELLQKFDDELYICQRNITYQSYDRLYELGEDKIEIDRSSMLGSGQFGIVLRGSELTTGSPVAVKTVDMHGHYNSKSYLKALLSELKILIYIGRHSHIVNLIGARTSGLRQGEVFLFMEYCPLGDLEGYLRNRRDSFRICGQCGQTAAYTQEHSTTGTTYVSMPDLDSESISTCDLYRWSAQTASAMEYLANKRVIHGDLATRNILLLDRSCVKITDFGLAKQLYNYTTYVKTCQTPLPWRSLAVESLREMKFSTQSDVWSFGVTLWEIFSLGDVPYSVGTQFSLDFITQLENGSLQLAEPAHASHELYEVMRSCWNLNPNERPTFTELKHKLEETLQQCFKNEDRHDN